MVAQEALVLALPQGCTHLKVYGITSYNQQDFTKYGERKLL